MDHRGQLVLLPPNRVWRTYRGGRGLDAHAGAAAPADTHFPEDWVASTTRAVNPPEGAPWPAPAGAPTVPPGVSVVRVGDSLHDFAALLASDPAYFLGAAHAAKHGPVPQLLVKLLDPAIRLHFQVHPTAEFARLRLGSPSGKTEAYHVLATRPDVAAPYVHLGFQRPPSRAALRRMIADQDLAALAACFDRVPVKPGDTLLVPGGVPHALGEGVFLVEVQEPSDLVVRFEFERGGYVLPESARFMGRDLDFCLDVFDFSAWPPGRVLTEAFCPPRRRRALGPDSFQDNLIGPERTPCFSVRHSHVRSAVALDEPSAHVAIVTDGAAEFECGGRRQLLRRHDKYFRPAGLGPLHVRPQPHVSILECHPPA